MAMALANEDAGVVARTLLPVEAECMRRVLPPDEFAAWLSGFLPLLALGA